MQWTIITDPFVAMGFFLKTLVPILLALLTSVRIDSTPVHSHQRARDYKEDAKPIEPAKAIIDQRQNGTENYRIKGEFQYFKIRQDVL